MGLVGWDAAGAHRLNLIFGIYSKYAEETSNLNPAAGTIVLNLSAVPVNEIWVVTHVAAANVTSNIPEFSLIAYIDANNYMLRQVKTPVGWYTWDGWVCLKSNDSIRAVFIGVNAGDDLYLQALGYKMKIDL